jgi:hypothetical protein
MAFLVVWRKKVGCLCDRAPYTLVSVYMVSHSMEVCYTGYGAVSGRNIRKTNFPGGSNERSEILWLYNDALLSIAISGYYAAPVPLSVS